MANESFERLQQLFHRALELPAERRNTWLNEQCGTDTELRRELQELLDADHRTIDPLEAGAAGVVADLSTCSVSCPQCQTNWDVAGPELPGELSCPSCAKTLVRASGDTVTVLRRDGDEPAVYLSTDDQDARQTPGRRFGDYEIIERIAEGGMGIVYKARQTALNRLVALKMIKAGELASGEEIQRFHTEAEAAAQLEHPGIVPIYEVGEQEGQHFFSMAFVDGTSLHKLIKDDGPLSPRRAAEIVRSVAEAVQFGHLKGVVHRDIKPHNILLDQAESPRVTDFGLAKHGDSELTLDGQVMGTPSYMPPEQAKGQHGDIGPVSDLYSMGATLYYLLTARPPFHSAAPTETLRQVIQDDVVPPRTLNSDIPRDLETICMKCLRKERNSRYSTAQELAADLSRWLEHKPIVARRVTAVEKTWLWCKRKPLAVGLLLMASLLLIGVSVTTLWYRQIQIATQTEHRIRSAQAHNDITELITRAARLRDQYHFTASEQLLNDATRRLHDARDTKELKAKVRQAIADLHLVRKLDDIRQQKATMTNKGALNLDFANGRRGEYALAFKDYGISILGRQSDTVVGSQIAESAVESWLVAALDDWANNDVQNRSRLLAVANAADDDQFRRRLRDPVVYLNRQSLSDLAAQIRVSSTSPASIATLALRLVRVHEYVAAADLVTRGTIQYPADFWLRFVAAGVLAEQQNEHFKVLRQYEAAIALRPTSVAAYNNLGNLLSTTNRLDEAERAYRRAIDLNPMFADVHYNLARLFEVTDRPKSAVAAYRRSLEIRPNQADAYNGLGNVLGMIGRTKESEAAYRQAINIEPTNVAAQINLAKVLRESGRREDAESASRRAIELDPKCADPHNELGILLRESNNLKKAEAAFRRAIKIDPTFAPAYSNLGSVLRQLKRPKEAERFIRQAIKLEAAGKKRSYNELGILLQTTNRIEAAEAAYRLAIESDPNYAIGHYNLGRLLCATGQPREAEQLFRRAIKLDSRYGKAYNGLGNALRRTGRLAQAEAAYRRAIELAPEAADTYTNLGSVLGETGRTMEAEGLHRQAIRIDPRNAIAHYNLGVLVYSLNRVRESAASYRRAIEIDPTFVDAYHNLGKILNEIGRQKEAERALRTAIDLDSDHAKSHAVLGTVFAKDGRLEDAEAAFCRAIQLDPDNAKTHRNLGILFRIRGRASEAESEFRQAIKLDPNDASCYSSLGVLLRDSQRSEAEACYRRAIELAPKVFSFHHNLGELLMASNRLEEAEVEFRCAISLAPKHSFAYVGLGEVLLAANRLEDAKSAFLRATELNSEFAYAHDKLAWLLAVCADARLRNGRTAVKHATVACELTRWKDFKKISTLAAAYAEMGDFPRAVTWQAAALEMASPKYKGDYRERLSLFERRAPYRERFSGGPIVAARPRSSGK